MIASLKVIAVAAQVVLAPSPESQTLVTKNFAHTVLQAQPYEGQCDVNPDEEICSATESFFLPELDQRWETIRVLSSDQEDL